MELEDFVARADTADKKIEALIGRCQQLEQVIFTHTSPIRQTQQQQQHAPSAASSSTISQQQQQQQRHQQEAEAFNTLELLRQLHQIRITILAEYKQVSELSAENTKLTDELNRLRYRAEHLQRESRCACRKDISA